MQFFKQAERLSGARNYNAALSNFQSAYALVADPNLLINIGRCLYNLNRFNESLAYYKLFYTYKVQLSSENEERLRRFINETQHAAIYTEATALYSAKQYEPALQKFQSAYETDPQPRDFINIGRCQHQLGRYADALSSYEAFKKSAKTASPKDIALAEKYISDSKTALMRQRLSSAPAGGARTPARADEVTTAGETGAGGRVNIRARAGLLPAFPVDPNQKNPDYQEGLKLFENGQYGVALPRLQGALDATKDQRLLIYVGRCLFLMGQLREAVQKYSLLESAGDSIGPPERAVLSELLSEARAALTLGGQLRLQPSAALHRRDIHVVAESR